MPSWVGFASGTSIATGRREVRKRELKSAVESSFGFALGQAKRSKDSRS